LNRGVLRMGVLRSVTTLYVARLYWKRLSGESCAAFMSFLHSVEQLVLANCTFPTFDQFAEVVCKPRSLRTLRSFHSKWEDGPTMELDRLPCPSQLQALHLYRGSPLLHWLMRHESCYRMLKIVRVDCDSVEVLSVELFGQFLRAIGSTLESLSVSVSNRESSHCLLLLQFSQTWIDVLPQDLTIHENNRLRVLTVNLFSECPPVFNSMATILLQISSPCIRVINIYVWREDPIEDDGSDLMDEIISRPMFSGLTSVTFYISSLVEDRPEWSWFKQKLPLCAARGILSVT
jgi:hypothetical protein